MIRSRDTRRAHVFRAIQEIIDHYPDQAEEELAGLLRGSECPVRTKPIILFYLRETGLYSGLVSDEIKGYESYVDSISSDIERNDDDGIDSFDSEGFPNE